jgi:hypothetical protein
MLDLLAETSQTSALQLPWDRIINNELWDRTVLMCALHVILTYPHSTASNVVTAAIYETWLLIGCGYQVRLVSFTRCVTGEFQYLRRLHPTPVMRISCKLFASVLWSMCVVWHMVWPHMIRCGHSSTLRALVEWWWTDCVLLRWLNKSFCEWGATLICQWWVGLDWVDIPRV